jgi:hypothetical protein
MINEAPKTSVDKWPAILPNQSPSSWNDQWSPKKWNICYSEKQFELGTTKIIAFYKWSLNILFLYSFWQKTWNIT